MYDRFFQSFQDKINEIDARLAMLQEAEDNYYITAKYLLELANRAFDLFIRSKVEERRQLLKLVLSNLRVEGKTVRYEAVKPFDTILNYADRQSVLPLVNIFKNRQIEFGFSFQNIKTVFETFRVTTSFI